MKRLLVCLLLSLGVALHGGEQIAVFGKNVMVVGTAQISGALPDDAAARTFLHDFRETVASGAVFERTMPLVNPPEWGKTISAATHGDVKFHPEFAGGFVCQLALRALHPHHRYILTLNGNPEKIGNALLPTPVPGMEKERFYDFLWIETDAAGSYDATLGIRLAPSEYDVRLYVKDLDDFKIVLYRDFFRFTVR